MVPICQGHWRLEHTVTVHRMYGYGSGPPGRMPASADNGTIRVPVRVRPIRHGAPLEREALLGPVQQQLEVGRIPPRERRRADAQLAEVLGDRVVPQREPRPAAGRIAAGPPLAHDPGPQQLVAPAAEDVARHRIRLRPRRGRLDLERHQFAPLEVDPAATVLGRLLEVDVGDDLREAPGLHPADAGLPVVTGRKWMYPPGKPAGCAVDR